MSPAGFDFAADTAASTAIELALRELEAFARSGLARFLAFLHPRIASKEAFGFQATANIRVGLEQSASNCQPGRARLTRGATAAGVNRDVVGVDDFGGLQRLQNNVLKRHGRKVIFKTAAIDIDLAASRSHPNSCD